MTFESFDADTSLRLIAESLSLVDRLGADPINVRSVRMADRTLVVEIVAASTDSIAVRAEIAGAMGALSGLDVPGLFPALGVQSFGVRALDAAGAELVWVVSSPEAAAFVGKGQPIEWLSRSWLQENTPTYRRSQADRLIGQVETTLRDLLDLHGSEHAGEEYIEQLWQQSAISELRDRAGAEGGNRDDPRALLEFSFLAQLRDAIGAQAAWISDGCIPEMAAFSETMTSMNRVRRKVAHYRPIGEEDLRTCREAAQAVLGPMGRAHPQLASDFLVDRWEEQATEIFATASRTVQSPVVPEQGSVSERRRRAATVAALETQLAGLESALDRMNQLVVPAQRVDLHSRVVDALGRWRDGLRQLIGVAVDPELSLAEAEAARSEYEKVLGAVGELRHEIQRLRVGMPIGPA